MAKSIKYHEAAYPEEGGEDNEKNSFQRIYDVVRQIPRGKVATYGQVARLAGNPLPVGDAVVSVNKMRRFTLISSCRRATCISPTRPFAAFGPLQAFAFPHR